MNGAYFLASSLEKTSLVLNPFLRPCALFIFSPDRMSVMVLTETAVCGCNKTCPPICLFDNLTNLTHSALLRKTYVLLSAKTDALTEKTQKTITVIHKNFFIIILNIQIPCNPHFVFPEAPHYQRSWRCFDLVFLPPLWFRKGPLLSPSLFSVSS